MNNTAFTGTSGDDAFGSAGDIGGGMGDMGDERPLDLPLSAGSTPNSTMHADLGPAPTASFTNSGMGGGDASLAGGIIGASASMGSMGSGGKKGGKKSKGSTSDAAMGVNAEEPMTEEPLSEVTMPYNDQPEITKAEPVALSEIDVKGAAGHAVSAAKEQTSQAVSAAKDAAGQALGQARGQIMTQLGSQKDRAAESITDYTRLVQQFGSTFRDNNLPQLAEYTDALAEKVDQAAGYLKNNDIDALVNDAAQFARRNAGAFMLGGLVLGIALGRFLKSSERGMAYTGEKNALVPVGQMDAYGNRLPQPVSTGRDIDKGSDAREAQRKSVVSDESIEAGHKPMHAQGYVPGGVLGGAPA